MRIAAARYKRSELSMAEIFHEQAKALYHYIVQDPLEASYSFTASETYEPETNQLPSLAIFRIAAIVKLQLIILLKCIIIKAENDVTCKRA